MSFEPYPFWLSKSGKGRIPDTPATRETAAERRTTAVPERRSPQPKQLDAGVFAAEVASFRLHLGAEGNAARTVASYT
jgi:hypothetical protein